MYGAHVDAVHVGVKVQAERLARRKFWWDKVCKVSRMSTRGLRVDVESCTMDMYPWKVCDIDLDPY